MLADSSIACWGSGEVEKLTTVKVQFKGLELYRNKGELFPKETYIAGF